MLNPEKQLFQSRASIEECADIEREWETQAALQKQLEPVRDACRSTARQLWRENPNLTTDEVLSHPDITETACKGISYDLNLMLSWVLPDITPHEELKYFRDWQVWKLEEAASLWLDLNPFVMLQSINSLNPDYWKVPIAPTIRERLALLIEKARRSALSGHLPFNELNGQFWIKPKDFYEWALKNAEEPAWRFTEFISELQATWDGDDRSNAVSKVDAKIAEIRRILAAIKTADPEFDSTSMPGRKQDFQHLCIKINRALFSVAPATFNDYLPGVCCFNPGARATDYYTNIVSKLG